MSELPVGRVAPDHGYFQSGAVRLHYLTWGGGHSPGADRRPPLICLHGGAHSAGVWADFAGRVADRWRVVALDQRGHGDSEWAPDRRYTREQMAEDIGVLLDALGLARAPFVGHSLGGNNALVFAYLHPERVARIALADIAPTTIPLPADRISGIADPPLKDSAETFLNEAMARNPKRDRAYFERALLPNLRQLPDGRWTWKHDPAYRMVSRDQRQPDMQARRWRQLAGVRCPVLLLHGTEGSIVAPETIARLARTIPSFRARPMPGAGHNVHLEQPEAFAAAVIPFLEEDFQDIPAPPGAGIAQEYNMPLKTPDDYYASLRDGRRVIYRGEAVPDVAAHPVIGVAVRHAAIDYAMAEDPQYRALAVVAEGEGAPYSRYYKLPQDAEDLRQRSALIEAATREGATLVVLIKEIGTDALFALHIVAERLDKTLGTSYLERVRAFYRHCRDHDLAVSVAQSDPKGDRALGPAEQPNPDVYLRVVEERPDGIVVRGAKVHTSVTTNAHEVIVLPTRAMRKGDEAYAVSFAVPVNAPGLTLVASPYGGRKGNEWENPISSQHKMMETLTVFEDVFVPNERVFLKGEVDFAGPLALTFVEFHRFTAVSYKLPLVDLLVGAAALLAEYNGIERVGHVRDKAIWLISYAETVRALIKQAAAECRVEPPGIAVPRPLLTNIAKHHFAALYHEAIKHVQDITGGLLVTGPSQEDWDSPETRPWLERFFTGKAGVTAGDRLKAINMVSDLTASDFGGYQAVLAVHAEGSIEAEKLAILRSYDLRAAQAYAKKVAGIG
jgi:aromatic ring hydroxylase/pimeloyl-ACP methyl ester carboxylesterase